jgi:hypothetical protein
VILAMLCCTAVSGLAVGGSQDTTRTRKKRITDPSHHERIHVPLSQQSASASDEVTVKLFFPRDGTQASGTQVKNWYFYWTQLVNLADLAYGGAHTGRLGYYDFDGTSGHLDKCIIYDTVTTSGNDDEGGGYGPPGIDAFGQTALHENKHRDQFWQGFTDTSGDGIPDYDPAKDTDGDWLSDSYEAAHGFDKNDRNSDSEDDDCDGQLDAGEDKNNNGVLDGDSTCDLEEEPEMAEAGWPKDSHNNQDWAKPGKNWP